MFYHSGDSLAHQRWTVHVNYALRSSLKCLLWAIINSLTMPSHWGRQPLTQSSAGCRKAVFSSMRLRKGSALKEVSTCVPRSTAAKRTGGPLSGLGMEYPAPLMIDLTRKSVAAGEVWRGKCSCRLRSLRPWQPKPRAACSALQFVSKILHGRIWFNEILYQFDKLGVQSQWIM